MTARRTAGLAALGALYAAAFGLAFRAVHPITSASIGADTAAPVIEWERLIAGRQLEGHLTQTAKPLLTGIDGILFSATRDWRAVSIAEVAAFALCVVLGALLAYRVGGLLSSSFVAVGFLLSPILLSDVSLAYAITWALLACLIAGLAVTGSRPRYWIAGVALMLGTLARPELVAVTGFSAGVLILVDVMAVIRRRRRPPRAAYLVLLGLLAIPILMVHDAALTGNPLFWANTAQIASEGRQHRGLVKMIGWLLQHFMGQGPLLPLAILGAIVLGLRRQWTLLAGGAGVILGISLFFIVIGARGTALSVRYLAPIDLGMVFAAGVGLSILDAPAARRWLARRLPALGRAAVLVATGAFVAYTMAPVWPRDAAVRIAVRDQVRLHANAQRAMAAIRAALVTKPSWRDAPPGSARDPVPSTGILVIVPPRLRAQAVVDLDLPLTTVAYSYGTWLDPNAGRPAPGTIIYHDRLDDKEAPRYKAIEIDKPTMIGSFRYVPLIADAANGFWVVRVEDPGVPDPSG